MTLSTNRELNSFVLLRLAGGWCLREDAKPLLGVPEVDTSSGVRVPVLPNALHQRRGVF